MISFSMVLQTPFHASVSVRQLFLIWGAWNMIIQLATDKVYSPATTQTFPGIEIDSVAQELQLPIPLVELVYLKELHEINSWSEKKVV